MKISIDITLSTLHLGKYHRVVTLCQNGRDPAAEFLLKLRKDDENRFRSLKSRIRSVAHYERYENNQTFNYLDDGIYEFKKAGLRLYAFHDTIEGIHPLIICTNGGTKNTKKGQRRDISKAKERRRNYFSLKFLKNTRVEISK